LLSLSMSTHSAECCLRNCPLRLAPSMNAMRSWTLTRKTSLLRKIGPIARRSSFANKDHLQPAINLATDNERRNDLEIVKGRAIACTIQLGSISSLRCQKSRKPDPGEDHGMRSDVFADDGLWSIDDQTIWWSQTGSNRRPHACKARALPAELWPRNQKTNAQHSIEMVGLGRLELPTSRLSSARSNQLSYKPLTRGAWCDARLAGSNAGSNRTSAALARVRPRRKRNEDGEIPPMGLKRSGDRVAPDVSKTIR
jgi:hypothetical protein